MEQGDQISVTGCASRIRKFTFCSYFEGFTFARATGGISVSIAAELYRDARSSERYGVDLPATLRAHANRPIDVAIDDLSRSGFRMTSPVTLPAASDITLGIAGVGARIVRIVRQSDSGYGCAFAMPLTHAEFTAALAGPQVIAPSPWQSGASPRLALPVDPLDPPTARYPLRTRLIYLFCATALLWAVGISAVAVLV